MVFQGSGTTVFRFSFQILMGVEPPALPSLGIHVSMGCPNCREAFAVLWPLGHILMGMKGGCIPVAEHDAFS